MPRLALILVALTALSLPCCRQPEVSAPPAAAAKAAPAGFVNRVWKVSRSTGVEPGMMYVFLSDGTLAITSPHGKPAFGTWKAEAGGLTMVEESIPYRVEILALSAAEFRIRVHSPGEPLEITFIPAEQPPGPA